MFFPMAAAVVTLVGVFGLVTSAFVNASAADLIFDVAGVCLVGGPLMFFGYVIIGLCIEFTSAMPKSKVRTIAYRVSPDVPLTSNTQTVADEWIPERLRREIASATESVR